MFTREECSMLGRMVSKKLGTNCSDNYRSKAEAILSKLNNFRENLIALDIDLADNPELENVQVKSLAEINSFIVVNDNTGDNDLTYEGFFQFKGYMAESELDQDSLEAINKLTNPIILV